MGGSQRLETGLRTNRPRSSGPKHKAARRDQQPPEPANHPRYALHVNDARSNPVHARIPNALTTLRIAMAGACVACLSLYDFPADHPALLWVTFVLFILAALTDALDGYLARKWDVISLFGKVMDPLADKLLVLGVAIVLAGPGFELPAGDGQASGLLPWMVVVIITRELLVTAIRTVFATTGANVAATGSGKAKMIAQSVLLPVILLAVLAQADALGELISANVAHWTAIISAWTITLITAWSGWPYVARLVTPPVDSEAHQ
jgi:CDP-diacylglycerol---glycerol-3-phosphate 3-phosphatidyltransferase